MQRRATFLAVFTLAALLLAGAPRLTAQTGTVRCESSGNQRAQCAIDRGAQVTLTKHLSSTPCQENGNWGVGQGFIWVTNGCRAEFTVTRAAVYVPPAQVNTAVTPTQLRACQSEADRRLPGYTYDQIRVVAGSRQGDVARVRWMAGDAAGMCTVSSTGRILQFTMRDEGPGEDIEHGQGGGVSRVTCESSNDKRQQCPIPRGAQIRLARQISQTPCRINDTFGTGDGYLWVTKGCRAEFEVVQAAIERPVKPVAPAPVTPAGPVATTRVTCQAMGNTQRACPIPAGGEVRLVRQISTQPCRLGMTYGVDASHIWVSNGCSAEFEVTSGGTGGAGGGAGGGAALPQRVSCASNDGARAECRIRAGGQVQLVQQLSTAPCTRNSTWGTTTGAIWVTKGCRGEFEVR